MLLIACEPSREAIGDGAGATSGEPSPVVSTRSQGFRFGTSLPGQSLHPIVQSALAENEKRSPALGLLSVREAERSTLEWDRRPRLAPQAELELTGDTTLDLVVSVPIYDFGLSKAERAEGDLAIELSQIAYWREQNELTARVITLLIDAAEGQAHARVTRETMSGLEGLSELADARFASGVADLSEKTLIDLRVSEMANDAVEDRSKTETALAILETLVGRTVGPGDVPSLGTIEQSLRPAPETGVAPEVARAELRVRVADRIVEQRRAQRFPKLVLRAGAEYANDSWDPKTVLALETDEFAGFSAGDRVNAARQAQFAAVAALDKTRLDLDQQRQELAIERQQMLARRQSLQRLIVDARASTELFSEQRVAGSTQLTDGIRAYTTRLDAERDAISAQADALRYLVEEAAIQGTLVARGSG